MIDLAKIKQDASFSLEQRGVLIDFELKRKDSSNLSCKLSLKGILEYPCDSCGCEDTREIDEQVNVIIHQGVYKNLDNKPCDVYEYVDNMLDLEELAHSELELILDEYFYCKNCLRSRKWQYQNEE